MLKAPMIILSLLVWFCGQSQEIEWQRSYGGSNNDFGRRIINSDSSEYIIAGYSYSVDGNVSGNHGESDLWIMNTNEMGIINWARCYGGTNRDEASDILLLNNKSYLLAGSTNSNDGEVSGNHGNYDFWIIQINSSSDIVWQKCYGGSNVEKVRNVISTNEGDFVVAGLTNSNDFDVVNNHGESDGWLIKIDEFGNSIWMKCYGGSMLDEFRSVIRTNDNGYLAVGSSYSNDGDLEDNFGGRDFWILKIDSNSNIQWSKNFGGSKDDIAYSSLQLSDQGYIISGNTYSNDLNVSGNFGESDFWIIKISQFGELEWQKCYGGSNSEGALTIAYIDNDVLALSGPSKSNDGLLNSNHGGNDYWVMLINYYGDLLWQKSFGGSFEDVPLSLLDGTGNGCIIAGSSNSNDWDVSGNHGNSDFWIVKFHDGLGIYERNNPNDINVFPNPANNELNIEISRSDILFPASGIQLHIFDIYSREITTQEITSRKCKLDVSAFAPGIYFAIIKDEKGIFGSKKFVVQ